MRRNFGEGPELRGHRLVAHLFRYRDVVALHLAIGLIRADPHPQAPLRLDQNIFDLTARVLAGNLYLVRGVQSRRGASVKYRYRWRTLDAVDRKLFHMPLDGDAVTTGPARQY